MRLRLHEAISKKNRPQAPRVRLSQIVLRVQCSTLTTSMNTIQVEEFLLNPWRWISPCFRIQKHGQSQSHHDIFYACSHGIQIICKRTPQISLTPRIHTEEALFIHWYNHVVDGHDLPLVKPTPHDSCNSGESSALYHLTISDVERIPRVPAGAFSTYFRPSYFMKRHVWLTVNS